MDLHRNVLLVVFFTLGAHAVEVKCPKEFVVCNCVEQKERGADIGETLEINCSEHNLTEVPDWSALRGLPITWVDLSDNHIREISNDAFYGLSFATTVPSVWIPRIDINRNPLHAITAHAFRGMHAEGFLLHIKHSKMKYFPSEAFRGIENLTDLFFISSHVRDIPSNSFTGFKRLRRIDLSGNKLEFLRSGIFNGMEGLLKSLYLNKMELSEFPWRALQHLKILWDLKLDWNKIKFLPDNIFVTFESVSDLFTLSMKHNDLTYISPKAFRRSKLRLYETYFDHNNISDITFLNDPCSLTFKTYGHINLQHNPINCDCPLYSLLKAGFYDLHGKCISPEEFVGIPWISKDSDVLLRRRCESSEVKLWNMPCMGYVGGASCLNAHITPWIAAMLALACIWRTQYAHLV